MAKHYKKRILSLALVLSMLLGGMAGTAFAAQVDNFTDVGKNDWYYSYVSYVLDEGLYLGTSDSSFSPNAEMTRGMFITVLGRYAGVDAQEWLAGSIKGSGVNFRKGAGTGYESIRSLSNGTKLTILGKSSGWYKVRIGEQTGYVHGDYVSAKYQSFSDVPYSEYYAGYAIWAYENEYISGTGNGSFSPNEAITREQICRILNNYATVCGYELAQTADKIDFLDADDISSWATEAVNRLQRAGILNGLPDGKGGYYFRPADGATRAEVAKMLSCFVDASGVEPVEPEGGENNEEEDNNEQTPSDPTSPPLDSDLAAPIVSSKLSGTQSRIRVGLHVSTAVETSQLSSVTLVNTGSGGFSYGSLGSDYAFVSEGSLSDNSLTVTTDGTTFTVKNGDGETVLTRSDGFVLRAAGENALTRVNGAKRYYGDFELRNAYNKTGQIAVINVVDMDDYVKGVVPYEFGSAWPAETLKAAAIAVRSYALAYTKANSGVYSKYGFDILPSSNAQVYNGRDTSRAESYFAATDAAVEATSNMYLCYNGSACYAQYFSSSGGATESAKNISGTSHPYMVGKIDPYEEKAASSIGSYYISTITLYRAGSTMKNLASAYGLSTLAANGIKVNTYSATGNVESVVLTDVNGKTATLTGYDRTGFLTKVGHSYTSYRFSVSYNSTTEEFSITRRGFGHNVGMSQWGAYAMAKYENMNFQEILGFYYTDVEIRYGA